MLTFKLEGLEQTVSNLGDLARATQRNAVLRTLLKAGEPTATLAASLAPRERGILSFSMAVTNQLTRRHKSEQRNRPSEVEVYIGPAGGMGALYYASAQEFGSLANMPHPYLRPAWESTKETVLGLIVSGLSAEVDRAAQRAARKAARLAR